MAKPPRKSQLTRNNRVIERSITHTYEGIVPPPSLLRDFDEIYPGTANRLIELAEKESLNRQMIELLEAETNAESHLKQLQLASEQSRAVSRSDIIGQILGFMVCIMSLCASYYLGIEGHDWLAGIIAAMPTAALIKAFILTKK